MKRPATTLLSLAILSLSPLRAEAQGLAEPDEWSLRLKAVKLDKLMVAGELYYYLIYTLTNTGDTPRSATLNLFAIVDRLRAGVPTESAAGFNQFRRHQLPSWPREDPTREFDNTPSIFKLKRYYDMPYAQALPLIRRALPRPARHTARLGLIAPGKTVRGLAVFKNVDRQMDYLGVIVKGLRNRLVSRADRRFIEDRVRLIKYHSPGDKANILENKIHYRGAEWVVLTRKRIPKLKKP